MAVRVLSVWVAILILSFVFTHSLEAEVFKWADENGLTHYSDKSVKKLNKFKKLKNTKARVSLPGTASPKTVQQNKSDREDFSEARGRLINLKARVNTCQNLPQKIEHCETFTCQMSHSSSDSFVIRHSISGMAGNNCHYEQTMPNNGRMTCNFSPWQRKQYGRLKGDMFSGHIIKSEPSVEMESSLKMVSMEKNKLQSRVIKEKTNYKLDGNETEKLFNEAIENGNCVITGY